MQPGRGHTLFEAGVFCAVKELPNGPPPSVLARESAHQKVSQRRDDRRKTAPFKSH